MKLLLDTHVVLWWLDDPSLLSQDSRSANSDPDNEVLVSAVVAWEIAIKRGLGKLTAPADIESAIGQAQFGQLPITMQHALQVEASPGSVRPPAGRPGHIGGLHADFA